MIKLGFIKTFILKLLFRGLIKLDTNKDGKLTIALEYDIQTKKFDLEVK